MAGTRGAAQDRLAGSDPGPRTRRRLIRRHRLALLAPVLAVIACAGSRPGGLEAMVGKDVDVAIEALGRPSEVIELGDGRREYVWQRIFTYDYGTPSFTIERWRYDSTFWFEDGVQEAPARLCATRLEVGFDLVVESWSYGCETIVVERAPWPAPEDEPHRIPFPPGAPAPIEDEGDR